jgi:putative ABC transport system permease protein
MIKNYLTTALRNIWKHKSHALINILGLALSMSICLLIILVVMDQASYDRFHKNKDRIYRITTKDYNFSFSLNTFATSPPVLGNMLKREYPQVEEVATIHRTDAGELEWQGKVFTPVGLSTDGAFFRLFDFPVEGNTESYLSEPNTIVLREETAEKWFGGESPLGKTLHSDWLGELTVTGVIPRNDLKSHMNFDYLLSTSSLEKEEDNWTDTRDSYNYLLMSEDADIPVFTSLFGQLRKEHYGDIPDQDYSFQLQALTDIAPGKLMANEIGFYLPDFMVYALIILACIVIFSAAINYTNLSIARALTRMKEVGLRKVLGAKRKQVVLQFLTESIIVSLAALLLAYGILQYLTPAFHDLKVMSLLEINPSENVRVYMAFLGFAIVVGVVAGLSPALIMSKFRPVTILKGFAPGKKLLSGEGLRKALIVSQFAVSMILVISVILVYRQSMFFLHSDHGFRQSGVLNIRLQENSPEKVAQWLSAHPQVQDFTFTAVIPGLGNRHTCEAWKDKKEDRFELNHTRVDARYIDVMDLRLIAGQNFPENVPLENEKFLILNEQAVSQFGFDSPGNAIGRYVMVEDSLNLEIIGVVEDFHFVSKFERIKPYALRLKPNDTRYVHTLMAGESPGNAYGILKDDWKKVDERHEFQAEWMEDEIGDYYMMVGELLYIVGYVTILAIVVACLGLFGMAAYSVEVRTKEIGVRKAMGADTRSIILTLSKTFTRILLIATLIAIPLAYYGNLIWLGAFAYRVPFGWPTLLAGTGMVLVFSLSIVFYQVFRASGRNPAHILRYE